MSKKSLAKGFKFFSSPSNYLMNQAGVSDSNALRQALNPGGLAVDNLVDATEAGGIKGGLNAFKSGDITDPGGLFHDQSGPIADPGAPPAVSETQSTQAAIKARDRIRRLVYRSQGRGSTIKVGSQAQPFTGQQKQLLGS